MLAPAFLGLFGLFGLFTMNPFDLVFWAALWWIAARYLRTGHDRLWLAFGVVAGVGLENKISVLFLGFGLVAGLVLGRLPQTFADMHGWRELAEAVSGVYHQLPPEEQARASSQGITARRAPSICSARHSACRRRSRATTAVSCGGHEAAPAR